MEAKQGTAFLGGQKVVTQGIQSTTLVDASYPGATVTVFNFGTTTLSTIFADNIGTPLANPFTASALTGDFIFYAANGHYTIQLSGAGMPSTETITDVLLNDPTASTTVTASAFISSSATPATSGVLRMATADVGPAWKANLGGADIAFTKNASDVVNLNTAVTLQGSLSTGGNPITGSVITGTVGTFSGAVTGQSFTGGSNASPNTFGNTVINQFIGTGLIVNGNAAITGTITAGAITGTSYTGGPIAVTNGVFSGNVSAAAISGTTGSFSSNVTVTGTLAIGGGTALASSNQTGTGNIVLSNTPTLVAPVLGVATATSINGLIISSTTGTFTLTNAKTFAVDNSIELAGTDGTKHTFAATAPTGGVLAYGVLKFQQFTANGTFTIPVGVTAVKVIVVGGGGAGGGGNGVNAGGGGGGAGGLAIKWLSGLTPQNTIVVTVGNGGTGNVNATGNTGGASSIASGTQVITTVTSNGGLGGVGGNAGANSGGAGGTATNGDINFNGNAGNLTWLAAPTVGALGAAGPFGAAPLQGAAGSANSGAGGGGVFANAAGAAGGSGIVIFEWAQ
jgi:hypothetical protein